MTSVATPDAAVASIEESIVRIVRLATLPRMQERVVAETGVPVEWAGYGVLRVVAEEGPLPVSGVARSLGLDVSTVSRHVAGLERLGLVARSGDPTDRRVAAVSLTEEGHIGLGRLRAARHRVFAEVLADWSAQDRATLAPLLARLAGDLVDVGGRS